MSKELDCIAAINFQLEQPDDVLLGEHVGRDSGREGKQAEKGKGEDDEPLQSKSFHGAQFKAAAKVSIVENVVDVSLWETRGPAAQLSRFAERNVYRRAQPKGSCIRGLILTDHVLTSAASICAYSGLPIGSLIGAHELPPIGGVSFFG